MTTGITSRTWLRPLVVFLLFFLGLYTALFLYHAVHLSFAHGEMNYGEASWLFAALRVRHGLPVYFDYTHSPYIAMVYSPLDFWLAGGLGALARVPDSWMVPLTRLTTVASTLLAGAAIFTLCRRLGCGRLVSALATFLFFTPTHTFLLWSFVARSDMLAAALGLCAITCMVALPGARGVLAAGILCGLAVASKQDAIAPLMACAGWLFFSERRKQLVPLLGGFLAALVVVFLIMGQEEARLLITHTLDLMGGAWFSVTFYARFSDLLALFGPVFPVVALGMARPATPTEPRNLVLAYFATSAFVLLLSAGKLGSASSYCLELIAVSCVLAGLGVQWLFEVVSVQREVFAGLLLLVGAPIAVQTATALNTAQNYRDTGADDRPLSAMLSGQDGPVLSENGYIALHGTDPPVLLDPLYFSVLAWEGRWDPAPLKQMVSEKQFAAVVLTRPVEWPAVVQGIPWFPPGVIQAVQQNYTYSGTSGRYYVYVRK